MTPAARQVSVYPDGMEWKEVQISARAVVRERVA